jgi:hypothetical protein
MKYSRQDRTKIIVLCVVLVGLWAVIGGRYIQLSRQWKAKTTAQHEVQPAAPQQQATSSQQVPLRYAGLVTPVAPPERDPFRPVISRRGFRAETKPAASESSGGEADVPILPPLPEAGSASGASSRVLHVTGIILGTPSTAVLRHGDQHYVVREGDWLDNQLRVHAIAKSSVTLRDSQRSYILRLGG